MCCLALTRGGALVSAAATMGLWSCSGRDRSGLDEGVARELFLRLEERLVMRELADLSGEDLARTVELQGVLARIRDALQKVESELR